MDIASRIDDTILIHEIEDTAHTGNRIFVLRDDLLPFGLGGNKVRIALEFVKDLKNLGKDAMIGYGGASSNMCRCIANLCKAEGIPCTVILSGNAEEGEVCNNQRLMRLFGARTVACTTSNVGQTVVDVMDYYKAQGMDPYYINGNRFGKGNEHVAARAYAKTYPKVMEKAARMGVTFDRVICTSGTQATQAGLICGHLLAQDNCIVEGIMISDRSEERAREAINEAAPTLLAELGGGALIDQIDGATNLITNKRRGGYEVYGQDILDCIAEQLCINGMPLDPIYTGKAFLGMQEYLLEQKITGQTILFVHTGGEPIFYDTLQKDQIG